MAQRVAGEQYETITGQLFEIARQLRQPSGYPFDPQSLKAHLQGAIEGRFYPMADVRISDGMEALSKDLVSWKKFYNHHFDLDPDLIGVKIPAHVPGFDRRIVVAKGLTLNRVYDVCAKAFPCWRYVDDLDTGVTGNDRTPAETYVIWVRDRVEADEENANLSANDLDSKRIKGQTLMERMLHELKYFSETGEHLDVVSLTLCSGSRYSVGDVPSAVWGSGDRKFQVGWSNPQYRDAHLRARAVVS